MFNLSNIASAFSSTYDYLLGTPDESSKKRGAPESSEVSFDEESGSPEETKRQKLVSLTTLPRSELNELLDKAIKANDVETTQTLLENGARTSLSIFEDFNYKNLDLLDLLLSSVNQYKLTDPLTVLNPGRGNNVLREGEGEEGRLIANMC